MTKEVQNPQEIETQLKKVTSDLLQRVETFYEEMLSVNQAQTLIYVSALDIPEPNRDERLVKLQAKRSEYFNRMVDWQVSGVGTIDDYQKNPTFYKWFILDNVLYKDRVSLPTLLKALKLADLEEYELQKSSSDPKPLKEVDDQEFYWAGAIVQNYLVEGGAKLWGGTGLPKE
jgi:hypothetical protein